MKTTRTRNFTDSCVLAAWAGAILLVVGDADAQTVVPANNLFVANWYSPGAIYQFATGGGQSTFYSGDLGEPEGLAFDNAGNLFVADSLLGNVYQITPGGTKTTFASGVGDVNALAFDRT